MALRNPRNQSLKHVGWLVLAAGATMLIQAVPFLQAALEYDRHGIAAGQWWRLVTGNFVHYTWYHWAANVGAFAALFWMVKGERGPGAWRFVLLAGCAVGLGVYAFAGSVTTYRGISGIDCALAAWLMVTIAREDRGRSGIGCTVVLLLVAVKAAFETATGTSLLPTSAPEGVIIVGQTHLIGLGSGICWAVVSPKWLRPVQAINGLRAWEVPAQSGPGPTVPRG